MTTLEILTAPDPRLKKKSEPVSKVDKETLDTLDNMLETMYEANGIGLAAPQVNIHKRLVVIDLQREGKNDKPLYFVNPEIVDVSDHDVEYEEGCLSVPQHYAGVVRPDKVTIAYLDREGKKQKLEADGLLACCIQHEIDHLDGILFIDHISQLKRNMILRKLIKTKKAIS